MSTRDIELTVECFVRRGKKYLMLRRSPNKKILPDVWIAPGGHIEFCEGVFAAAKREIKEETGLEISNLEVKVIGLGYLRDIQKEFCFYILTAEYLSGNVVESSDEGRFSWLTPEQILMLPNLLGELKYLSPHIFSKEKKILSVKVVYSQNNNLEKIDIE